MGGILIEKNINLNQLIETLTDIRSAHNCGENSIELFVPDCYKYEYFELEIQRIKIDDAEIQIRAIPK